MQTIVGQIFDSQSAVLYLEQRLRELPELSSLERQQIAFEIARAREAGPAQIPMREVPELPRHTERHVIYLQQLLEDQTSLVPGETLTAVPDVVGYLTEEYGGMPAGTVVVKRTTSHAVLYHAFAGATYENGVLQRSREPMLTIRGSAQQSVAPEILRVSRDAVDDLEDAMTPATAGVPWLTLLQWLGEKLLTYVAGQAQTKLFTAIFGPGDVPTWYSNVYREFASIVARAFDDNARAEMEVKLNTAIWAVHEYNYVPDEPLSRDKLTRAWALVVEVRQAILTRFGYTLAPNFCIVTGLHIFILREQARHGTPSAREGHAQLITETATNSKAWLEAAADQITADRRAQISGVELKNIGFAGDPVWVYAWRDNATGHAEWAQSTCCTDGRAAAQQSRDAYYASIDASIRETVQPLRTFASRLASVALQPFAG